MLYNPDWPPCKRCGVAPWFCTCESCSCPAPSYFTHEHLHERSAGSGGEYASEPAYPVPSKSDFSQALSAALKGKTLTRPPFVYETVDGVRHTLESVPQTVSYLSNDYHLRNIKKRQAELDQVYYDLHDYKGPFGYNQWRKEYELNGTQYALDRLVDLWTPEIEQAKNDGIRYFSKEFDRKKHDWGWDLPLLAIQVALVAMMILVCFIH